MSNLHLGRRASSLALLTSLLLGASVAGLAQQLTGVLSGTVTAQTGAAIPNATGTLKNQASNDLRQDTSNGSGYFTFSAVQPGSYTLHIDAKGFQAWEENGIAFSQGSSLTIPTISLKIGSSATSVEVITSAESIVPQDTGEVATTLDSKMVNNLPIVGRDAGELLRIMPGMALANGLTQGAGFTDQTVGTNSGPIGSYSPNGQQPNGSMAYMLDGANLLDPGNQGTQIANINADMTAEVKVLMSGYDAAYAKGPVVFQAISKSGGAHFHGEGYLYARNNIFNSEDAYQRSQGQKKVDAYQYYPGGNIGGPVVLPFVKFNRNHDKLFFWFGYEYMVQQQAGQLWQTFVPTADMRAGNFSPAVLNPLKAAGVGSTVTASPCATAPNPAKPTPCGNLYFPNGIIPSNLFDPQALALLKTYPLPNIDPATHSGHNYQYLDQSPQNRWEQTEKIDYAPTDNTKITFSYARQVEVDQHPVQFWWSPSDRSLPSPSPLTAPTTANVVMANVTHVFGPTLTNETVFTYARYINPLSPTNPTANNPATYGFNVPGLFGQKRVQLPNIESWSGNGAFAGYYQQGVFGGPFPGGAFGGIKKDPALYDNLSKVIGTHTIKGGFYWDANENVQSNGNDANGTYFFETYGSTTTTNLYADLLLGRAQQYQQGNSQYLDDLIFHQYSLYLQDSWKVNKRLTLNYGGRADHIGQWYPSTKQGAAVFDIGKYVSNPTAPNAGLLYHSIDSHIPISGFKSPLFYYEPRLGAAYDLFGNGKTVLRGGFAIFRYQLAYNTTSGPADLALGGFNYATPTGTTSLSQITTFSLPAAASPVNCGTGCSVAALQPGDGKTPYTENYSFSVDQALPGRMNAEISYVGNRSRDLLFAGDTNPYNLNQVPLGGFFGPDPITHQTYAPNRQLCEFQLAASVTDEANDEPYIHGELHLRQGARYPR